MGKAARKLNKALQKNKTADTNREIQSYRERVSALMNENKFAKAIEVLAEAVGRKIRDVELMYDTAYCYFMVGDYERAASWLSNVLTYSPGNRQARVLLGRLCFMQDKEEEGLAVYDYVLKNWKAQMSEPELKEISETLEYYGMEMPETIHEKYPNVEALLKEQGVLEEPEEESEPEQSSAMDSLKEKLAALKKLTAAKAEEEPAVQEEAPQPLKVQITPAPAAEEKPVQEPEAKAEPAEEKAVPSAADTLARLKEKLAALKAKTAANAEEAATPEAASTPVGAQFIEPAPKAEQPEAEEPVAAPDSEAEETPELEPEELTQAENGCGEEDEPSVEEIIAQAEAKREEILQMPLSLAEKLGAMNNFAGAYYFGGNWQAAEVLLRAALEIDPKSPETIRNLALLLKDSGRQEAALQCAARLPIIDFALLSLLRA